MDKPGLIQEGPNAASEPEAAARLWPRVLLLLAVLVATLLGVSALISSNGPLSSPSSATRALGDIGFACRPIPPVYLGEDTPFETAITCTKGDAHATVIFVAEDADAEVLSERVAHVEAVCSDADHDDGADYSGLTKAVWVNVNSTTSTADALHATSEAAEDAVSKALGVPLRDC